MSYFRKGLGATDPWASPAAPVFASTPSPLPLDMPAGAVATPPAGADISGGAVVGREMNDPACYWLVPPSADQPYMQVCPSAASSIPFLGPLFDGIANIGKSLFGTGAQVVSSASNASTTIPGAGMSSSMKMLLVGGLAVGAFMMLKRREPHANPRRRRRRRRR